MKLSSVFEDGDCIDRKFTGEGQNLSPPLAWSEVPKGVKSFALICDDPDAPSPQRPAKEPWVHWIIYNIPSDTSALSEGVERKPLVGEPDAMQGANSWPSDNVGYRGPMPPRGSGPHRYFFRLFALDVVLKLPPERATKSALLAAMNGHVLAECQRVGVYQRE